MLRLDEAALPMIFMHGMIMRRTARSVYRLSAIIFVANAIAGYTGVLVLIDMTDITDPDELAQTEQSKGGRNL